MTGAAGTTGETGPVPIDPNDLDPYTQGLLDGIFRFAWMRDGTYYVGTTGTSLRVARRHVLDERGYGDRPDPFYPE